MSLIGYALSVKLTLMFQTLGGNPNETAMWGRGVDEENDCSRIGNWLSLSKSLLIAACKLLSGSYGQEKMAKSKNIEKKTNSANASLSSNLSLWSRVFTSIFWWFNSCNLSSLCLFGGFDEMTKPPKVARCGLDQRPSHQPFFKPTQLAVPTDQSGWVGWREFNEFYLLRGRHVIALRKFLWIYQMGWLEFIQWTEQKPS